MNRRRFLALLAGTGAASATSYFLPPIGGWHSDVVAKPGEWEHYDTVSWSASDALLLEAVTYSREEIIRMFLIPPHLIFGTEFLRRFDRTLTPDPQQP